MAVPGAGGNVRSCWDQLCPLPTAEERRPRSLAAQMVAATDAARQCLDRVLGDFRLSEPASMLCATAIGAGMLGLAVSLLYLASQDSSADAGAEGPAPNAFGTLLMVGFVLSLMTSVVCCGCGISAAMLRCAPQAPDDPAANA
jgi:hypothetical protein